jgi:hypothetical protein
MVELHDTNGYVDDVATNTGWAAMRDIVEKSKVGFDLQKLFSNGKTESMIVCSNQAMFLASKEKDNSIRSTFIHLANTLSKAKDFAVIQY